MVGKRTLDKHPRYLKSTIPWGSRLNTILSVSEGYQKYLYCFEHDDSPCFLTCEIIAEDLENDRQNRTVTSSW